MGVCVILFCLSHLLEWGHVNKQLNICLKVSKVNKMIYWSKMDKNLTSVVCIYEAP